MNELSFNSNEMCKYLLKAVVKLQAENVALREFFLATVKQNTPGTNIDTLRKGMVDASVMIVPQLLKLVPAIDDLHSSQLQSEIKSILEFQRFLFLKKVLKY